ncbi:Protein kinase superfamily protein [Klebsormidium nitens]|uniref:Protein kinase superfamily protein n=1 Tax=Klebsormidium nitens TaxID=105231 RepID=A0A1Y1HPH3_KLENI|nr:Protein kinase superfamily protein [Klebsormidium nitens]|eukprot:GAQ79963.1 Protein kinase superfamily protein [Klebsormidium nitens]
MLARPRLASSFLLILALSCLLQTICADYVVTWPRPGAPEPPGITPGECPLTYHEPDIQQAKQVCSSGASSGCCNQLQATLFSARVRYANDTGRLLLPQASADACVQSLGSAVAFAETPLVGTCGITSRPLSEDSGRACGEDLTSVYDFWNAADRTFPGLVGPSCYGQRDCSVCTSLITSEIMALGRSTTALLSTPSCQDLAQVAMTAAAYPVTLANSMARCLHLIEITPVPQRPKCTIFDWDSIEYTGVVPCCGPQQVRPDRCCEMILGMYGQVHSLYLNQTGHGFVEDQAEACAAEFKAQLAARGVPPSVPDNCLITPALLLNGVGCYNYTTILQRVPAPVYEQIEAVCNPATSNCSQCVPVFLSLGAELANTTSTTYLNQCMLTFGTQYFGGFSTMEDVTDRLNCFYQFPPGLELSLPSPRSKSSRRNVGLITGISTAIAVTVVAFICLALLFWRRSSVLVDAKTLDRMASLKRSPNNKGLKVFSRRQLRQATNNFDESALIGQGGSGKVYVGLLKGHAVAIKEALYSCNSKRGAQEAWNELTTLACCRHRNLVVLKGCCVDRSHISLVYELMEEGSLEDHLFEIHTDTQRCPGRSITVRFLDWPTRLKIAQGTASGLAYLHDECTPRIIHRDVKPSNILLTSSTFEPKLADFGLARLAAFDETHVTTGIAGTWGYLSPEYMAAGQLTEKADVYSFGVVLLTLLAGRRPQLPDAPADEVFLPEWAWSLAERNELGLLIDPRLEKERNEHGDSMDRMTRLALFCVHTATAIRPSMRRCADILTNSLEVPPLPYRPVTLHTIASMSSSDSSAVASAVTDPSSRHSLD